MRSLFVGARVRLRGLRYGFLVVPAAFTAGLVALAFGLLAIDRAQGQDGLSFGVASDPEAARTVLTVIATGLVTVVGVVFSITIVTLQLVSQQFTPRALRGFLADRITQSVAGLFVGVAVFCLVVLRTVSSESAQGEQPFVPALSVTAAIVLAVAALALLFVFIDHIARNIQVSAIAGGIAKATLATVDRLYPEPFGAGGGEEAGELLERWRSEGEPRTVRSERPGYLQTVTLDHIPEQVGSPGLRIAVHVAPGDFVTEREPLASWWPGEEDRDVGQALRMAIVVADERDMKQDPGYGIRQLADIATKAISPGVNDPTTAWTCIRYLQAVMERLACRRRPDPIRRYDGDVLVVTHQQRFEEFVDAAYTQIGRYATDARIAGALLESLRRVREVAAESGGEDRLAPLEQAARRVAQRALAEDLDDTDRADVERRLAAVAEGAPAGAR